MSLPKQNIIRKRYKNNNAIELNNSNNKSKKYKIKVMSNSIIYIKKSKSGYLLRFYYMIL